MSDCLRTYNNILFNHELHQIYPRKYNKIKRFLLNTEICVPRNHDLNLYCNLKQNEDNNLCSNDELFVEMEADYYGQWFPNWFK